MAVSYWVTIFAAMAGNVQKGRQIFYNLTILEHRCVFKRFYQRFLDGSPGRLHFAAHSHHYWPDVTRAAALTYWDDCAKYVDNKWEHIWGEIIPRARGHVARLLGVSEAKQVVFAPNTHEFVVRLFSCFELGRPIRVLSTDSEFHSFRRQAQRLEEAGEIELTRVPVEPIADFSSRFVSEARRGDYDFVFFSMVFYNSGFVVADLPELVQRLPQRPVVAVDGYHAFCALPLDLRAIDGRVFYLAGGYKYAQSGEGACFMYVPTGCDLRPRNTGWFASFGELERVQSSSVYYSDDGMRFAGATFDPSAIYRFNAVMDLFEREGITIAMIHEHVTRLQEHFIKELKAAGHPLLCMDRLLYQPGAPHGHFLTFVLPSAEHTARVAKRLAEANITVDFRDNRLRFGFGLYQDEDDITALFRRLAELRDDERGLGGGG